MKSWILRIVFILIAIGIIYAWYANTDNKTIQISETDTEESSAVLFERTSEIVGQDSDESIGDENPPEALALQGTSVEGKQEEKKIDLASLPQKEIQKVPFVIQAPEAQWSDKRFQDACEEASILMAFQWVGGDKEMKKSDATAALEEIFKAEAPLFGEDTIDTSAKDTQILMQEFFDHDTMLVEDVTIPEIIATLAKGKIIIVPTDGTKLENPYFSGEGPERHMLVITGYDQKKEEFIVNDPGTKRGKAFRYSFDNLYDAIRDYPTGNKEPITEIKKNMIVVSK